MRWGSIFLIFFFVSLAFATDCPGGDCDDKSILLTVLLKELGYKSALILFDSLRHIGVGLACPEDQLQGGYCYVETTTMGWHAGKLPNESYKNPSGVFSISNGSSYSLVEFHKKEREEIESLKVQIIAKEDSYQQKLAEYEAALKN